MLSFALVLVLNAAPAPFCAAPPRMQGRHRGRRTCHSEGMKCDTGRCCKGLKCVEEIVGKVCRKDGAD